MYICLFGETVERRTGCRGALVSFPLADVCMDVWMDGIQTNVSLQIFVLD